MKQGYVQNPIKSFEEDRAPKPNEMGKIIVSLLAREGVTCNVEVAQKLYTQIIELIIRSVISYGRMGLPYGWGSFKLKVLYSGPQTPIKLPGDRGMITRTPRPILRYEEGTSVRTLLKLKNHATHSTVIRYDSALPDEFMPPMPKDASADAVESPVAPEPEGE